jgi:glycosyltransferase involved in cell wall biosynthesis
MNNKKLSILGIRGIPAQHGGFETFAEKFALYLVKKGWSITVYCQQLGDGEIHQDSWLGIDRVHIPVKQEGSLGSLLFDLKSILHTRRLDGKKLTLGYNTAIFNVILRLSGHTNFINMDGLEWRREKWSLPIKIWLYINERLGCLIGNHLVADHPVIEDHLATRVSRKKITMIPYGATAIESANLAVLEKYNLLPNQFVIVIAIPRPENLILEIVKGFCQQPRSEKLVLLGHYDPDSNDYHRKIINAANSDVLFLGAIYDKEITDALRFYCKIYVHGHTVGGTNPSLVEALGASSAILAHDNHFNRWVTDNQSEYFRDSEDCGAKFTALLSDEGKIMRLKKASRKRFEEGFIMDDISRRYEDLILNLP